MVPDRLAETEKRPASAARPTAFEIDTVPTGDVHLCLEQPRAWAIAVNGHPLCADIECGWWVDPSMRRVALDPAILREGMNEVTLEGDYDEAHPGLEIVYLLGRFGTAVDGTDVRVTEEPRSLSLGDWVPRGLAFYAGSVVYRRKARLTHLPGESLFLQVPDYRGVAVRVVVNGKSAGIIAWEPNELDITACLPKGRQKRTSASRFSGTGATPTGPFTTRRSGLRGRVLPSSSRKAPIRTDEYQLVPCRLMKPPIVITRKPVREGAE